MRACEALQPGALVGILHPLMGSDPPSPLLLEFTERPPSFSLHRAAPPLPQLVLIKENTSEQQILAEHLFLMSLSVPFLMCNGICLTSHSALCFFFLKSETQAC